MSGQSHTGTNLLPNPYGFIRIWFQINFLFLKKSIKKIFTDRVLLTIRHMDKILGKVSPLPYISYSLKIMVAYGELRIYFAVQIPPSLTGFERLR